MIHAYESEMPGAWDEFIKAMHSGEEVEIDSAMYYYWLEVLPPIFMGRALPWPDPKHPKSYDFGFAEGLEPITVFWTGGDKFFCRRTNIMNPYA